MTRAAPLLALALAATAWAQAGGATFEGQGQARIANEDRVAARARALDDAMRNALERAFEAQVAPEIRAARARALRAALGRPRALVDRYRVLSEQESGGLYQLTIEATVDPQALLRALEADRGTAAGPAAPGLVLRAADGWAESALRRGFTEAGVKLVPAAAATLTVRARAVEEGPIRGTELVSVRVDLGAELARGGVSRPVESTARAFAPDAAAARAVALGRSAADLARAVARVLEPAAEAGGVAVQLVGRFGYRSYQAYATAVAALPGVSAVAPRRFGHGWVTILVRTAATPAELGARLGRLTVPGLAAELVPGGGELRVRLEPVAGAEPGRAP
jgi:hypothetical protein